MIGLSGGVLSARYLSPKYCGHGAIVPMHPRMAACASSPSLRRRKASMAKQEMIALSPVA